MARELAPSIVFFGTGPVAAKSLELLTKFCNIEAVITKPKPKHHKGTAPVLDFARKIDVDIFTTNSRMDLDQLITNKSFASSLGVLIDFGIIVSQQVISSFSAGIVNSHFSILPSLRGADPITFAILSGQQHTGVSLMMIVPGLDEGPLVDYAEIELPKDITTPELTDRLILLSNSLIKANISKLVQGTTDLLPQSVTGKSVSYSHKLTKEDGIIDWNKSALELEREIRAFADWPASKTHIGDIEVTITKAKSCNLQLEPSAIWFDKKNLIIGCGVNSLSIIKIKPTGKSEMDIASFLAGYHKRIQDRA
ncbi:methionyl-tRNA formyltransferase [Candidatus Saccharibacteria bacterium]|nr:methionyl-tRNA formyltransferase [Candidatus Saccharibacteria bacterium]